MFKTFIVHALGWFATNQQQQQLPPQKTVFKPGPWEQQLQKELQGSPSIPAEYEEWLKEARRRDMSEANHD